MLHICTEHQTLASGIQYLVTKNLEMYSLDTSFESKDLVNFIDNGKYFWEYSFPERNHYTDGNMGLK